MPRPLSAIISIKSSKNLGKDGDKDLAILNKEIVEMVFKPLTDFHQFMDLPIELRFMTVSTSRLHVLLLTYYSHIDQTLLTSRQWKFTLVSRFVEVSWDQYRQGVQVEDGYRYVQKMMWQGDMPKDIGFWSRTALPVALAVNRESRIAVLPFYPLCFASASEPARTRFNLDIDTLSVHGQSHPFTFHIFDHMSPKERSRLKNLVVLEQHDALTGLQDNEDVFWTTIEEKIERIESLKQASIGLSALGSVWDSWPLEPWDERLDANKVLDLQDFYDSVQPRFTAHYPTDILQEYELQPDDIPNNHFLEEGARKPSGKLANCDYLWVSSGEQYQQFCS